MNYGIEKFYEKINKQEEILPCLFLGGNLELTNAQVYQFSTQLCKNFGVNFANIHIMKDNHEKIKISEIKEFLLPAYTLPTDAFQIFIVENISRFTTQSSNSCLKIFEEPGKKNIFLLTNTSESGILDTILSRVQILHSSGQKVQSENSYYQYLLGEIILGKKQEALSYFYKSKLEKNDYIEFLENIILFSKKNFCFLNILDEIQEDILGISQNNVNAKYIIDKYLLMF